MAAPDIAADVALRLRAAGRPAVEAAAAGQIIAVHYEARATRFEGKRGTAEDMYRADAPDIVAGTVASVPKGGPEFQQTAWHAGTAVFDQFEDRGYSGNGGDSQGWGTYVAAGALGERGAAAYRDNLLAEDRHGALYTVDIPSRDRFIGWHDGLNAQPAPVMEAIRRDGLLNAILENDGNPRRLSPVHPQWGKQFYLMLGARLKGQLDAMPLQEKQAFWQGIGLGDDADCLSRPPRQNGGVLASYYLRSRGIEGTWLDRSYAGLGEHYAVFDPGKVQVQDRALFQSASEPIYETTGLPHLYSGVARAVNGLTQAKGSGGQMLAMLNRTPGVKPEEMRWLGLDVWLRDQERVSKEQIQDYIWANALQLKEVVKGAASANWDRLYDIEGDARDRLREALPAALPEPVGNASTPDGVIHALSMGWAKPDDLPEEYRGAARAYVTAQADLMKDAIHGGEAKYASYTLPGGANYRELLITLPAATDTRGWTADGIDAGNGRRHVAIRDAAGNSLGALRNFAGTDEEAIERYARNNRQADAPGTFRSDHWDEPNVLAHVRLNERMAPDGQRVLLIEEIQSDWHQAGRKAGYGDRTGTRYGIVDQDGHARGEWASRQEAEQYLKNPPAFVDAARSRIREFGVTVPGVPDAPFKTSWPALAMKRMIAYAVDHGFDRVAWLPGDVHAERYSLAKHVDELVWFPNTQDLQGFKDGREVVFQNVPQHKLPDYVGKEVADRLLNAPTQTSPAKGGGVNHVLSGQDLQVGGAGMKGFYDTILPAETQKLVGKFGARVAVGEIPRGVTEREREDIEPDAEALAKYGAQFDRLKAEAQAANGRALMWELGSAGGAGKQADFDRADALYEQLAELRNTMIGETLARQGQPVHGFDVTDDLRRAVLASGLTLFQVARGQIQFNDGGRSVITLFGRADASTFLHETAHQWLDELLRDATHPLAPASLTKDAATVREWLGAGVGEPIGRRQHERFARAFEQYMMDGQAPSPALAEVFARFREWLVSIYRTVTRLGQPVTPEIRGVFDRMLTAGPERPVATAPERDTAFPAAAGQRAIQPDAAPAGHDATNGIAPDAAGQPASAGVAASPMNGVQPPQVVSPRPVLDTLLAGMRPQDPANALPLEPPIPMADRLAAFEKRLANERHGRVLQVAPNSGVAGFDALHAPGNVGAGLPGARDKAAAALERYGKDGRAVEAVGGRGPDGDAVTARFHPIDTAIGGAAAAAASRNDGRSILDGPAQKAAEPPQRSAEAGKPSSADATPRPAASASMGR
jgi:hypothetical protein